MPRLQAAGWTVGAEATNHLQLIEVAGALPTGIEALPTFILVEDGREIRRRIGDLDPWSIGELFKGDSERPRPRTGLHPGLSAAPLHHTIIRPPPMSGGFLCEPR